MVVVQVDGIDKGFYQPFLAITVRPIQRRHILQEEQNHIPCELKAPGQPRLCAGRAEGLFLVCQFIHTGFRHLIDDAHFDGFHHIGERPIHIGYLLIQRLDGITGCIAALISGPYLIGDVFQCSRIFQ